MASKISLIGLILSVAGALLDFASATLIMQSINMQNSGMINLMNYNLFWSIFLYILGVLLLVTGFLGVTRYGMGRMNVFGGLMILYGIVMLVIGSVMVLGMIPMTQESVLINYGMFVVGFAMIINGGLMATKQKMEM